jgi:hypothetical protein
MNPEIEKLIDLALADGQITEKERNVVLKKAAELGIDADEVEMTLEGKLHQMLATQTKQKEKVGNIKTCPACGASVKAMELSCSSCFHEFIGSKGNNSILELLDKLEKLEKEKEVAFTNLNYNQKILLEDEFHDRKKDLIKNHPIPNTKEDILEFLTFTASKITKMSNLDNPWAVKADEVVMKGRILFKTDLEMLSRFDNYQAEIKKRKKGPILIILVCIALIIVLSSIILIFGGNLINK